MPSRDLADVTLVSEDEDVKDIEEYEDDEIYLFFWKVIF